MRRVLYLSLILLFGLLIILSNGCGSSRQAVEGGGGADMEGSEAEYDEIERLLGITRDEPSERESSDRQTQQQKVQTGEQDDLIRLLEVDEGKPKEETTTITTAEDKRVTRLQSQVDELQKEVQKKDMEIADLKAQLRTKQEALDSRPSAPSQDTRYYSQPTYTTTPPAVSDSYGDRYQYNLGLFHERRYQEAITGFEELLAASLNHSLSDNAQYWIGECYYAMGRFQEAIMAFEKVFTFSQSNKNDYAQFKIGQCYFKLGDKERSNQEFQQLIDNYPDSELVIRARNYLAQF